MSVYIIQYHIATLDEDYKNACAFKSLDAASLFLVQFIQCISHMNGWPEDWIYEDMDSILPSDGLFTVEALREKMNGLVWNSKSDSLGYCPFEIYIYKLDLLD